MTRKPKGNFIPYIEAQADTGEHRVNATAATYESDLPAWSDHQAAFVATCAGRGGNQRSDRLGPCHRGDRMSQTFTTRPFEGYPRNWMASARYRRD
jgi:hypothetical protein